MPRRKLNKTQDLPTGREQRKRTNYKTLVVEDGAYKTYLTDKFLSRNAYEEKDIRNIESFIPGRIVKILISEGQAVQRGDALLVLEAMKMNNRIMAPVDGTIKSIKVKQDDRVPKNHLLIVLE